MNGSVAGGGVSEEVIRLTRGPSGEAGAAALRVGPRRGGGGGERAGTSAAPSVDGEGGEGDAAPASEVPPRGGGEPRALRERRPAEPRPGSAAPGLCRRRRAEHVAPEGDCELCEREATPSDLVFRDNSAEKRRRLLGWKRGDFQEICAAARAVQ